MDPRARVPLGRTGLSVTRLGLGCAPLGGLFEEVSDGAAGQWGRLARRLAGGGVPSLDDALREMQLDPVHAPLRAIFADGLVGSIVDGPATEAQLDELERRLASFLEAVAAATGVEGDARAIAAEVRVRADQALTVEWLWQHLKDVELSNVACLDLDQLNLEWHLALGRVRQRSHLIQSFFAGAGLEL